MRHNLLVCFLMLFGAIAIAQHPGGFCGLHQQEGATEMFRTRLAERKALIRNGVVSQRDVIYVPIRFHLVAENDGDGRVVVGKVLDQLCELNEDYAPYDIQFYLKQRDEDMFNYLNNTTVYSNHPATVNSIMSLQDDNRALNVWIVENADLISGGPGTTLAYYSPFKDWIVISKNQVKGGNTTLTHEIGHFFALDHPFGTPFEQDPYGDEADEVGVPCPTSIDGHPTEKVDGTNCEFAGDMLCDTPPDYNNGLGWSNCNFTANVLDPNGTQIDPQENLYMSYFLECPDEAYYEDGGGFSPQQVQIINVDINATDRNYLFVDATPYHSIISEQSVLISPIDNEVLEYYNSIDLVWGAAPNATAYLLEYSIIPTFPVSNTESLVVYGTAKTITDLDDDRKYYWKVRPFNVHSSCMPFTLAESFTTGTLVATDQPSFVSSIAVSPNPVRAEGLFQLVVESNEAFVATVGLFDLNGRAVQDFGVQEFGVGRNTNEIAVHDLPAGVYLLKVQTDVGFLTEKVVVTR